MVINNKTAVALGSFDGLHTGHMSVIACTLSFRECGLIPYVMLFDSHPLKTLTGKAPAEILQPSLRKEILDERGVGSVFISFEEIKNLSCREFFTEILLKKLNVGAVCCGSNYRFGKNGSGGVDELKTLCEEFGVELKVSPEITYDGSPVSSTRIRQAIENGNIPLANAMLGREFRYKYTVVSGDRRGRLMGAPTINQHFSDNFVIPKIGVYASLTVVDNKEYPSVTNIGLRPSFENEDLRSETCILGFSGDLYGKEIEVRLLKYLRSEMKFNSMDALGAQIRLDAETSEKIFAERGGNGNV
ncbi:MAG: bifunctional riboflavin kinase/FAD synthetase [Clostridia bacterium]|nr:bifunctional riboflavin kinase/FAD synthetase [Clostridia bacterium]